MYAAIAALTRHYPLLSGRGQIANGRLAGRLFPLKSETRWARSPGGYVRASLDDYVGRTVYFCGDLDAKITWLLKKLIKPNDTVLDIGANIGVVTLWMSRLVGTGGRVHSFEPNPEIIRVLTDTFKFNNVENISLYPIGLGSEKGVKELRVPFGNRGRGTFHAHDFAPSKIWQLPIEALDSIDLEGHVSVAKIDVEGFEYDVLSGAANLLTFHRPVIIFESNGLDKDRSVTGLLAHYNYSFLSIPRCLWRMRTSTQVTAQSHDLIAIPNHRFNYWSSVLRAS